MHDLIRDKTTDTLASTLNAIGVKAEQAQRGDADEKVEDSWYQPSLGIIDIPEGPIKWVNILKKDRIRHSPPDGGLSWASPMKGQTQVTKQSNQNRPKKRFLRSAK